ncbi:MAG: metal-dependent transcriptional regulator [Planctomycetaceae bacterium]
MPGQPAPRKLSLAVENYLKAVLQIGTRTGNEWVTTGSLAEELNLSPGTVTSMLKTLDDSKTDDFVEYKPYEGVRLTAEGKRTALLMLRRHRLIELFLVKTLNLTWDQVHEEAENMEHAVSDYLIDRIDDYLGNPESDPHGDPIPSPAGELRGEEIETVSLGRSSQVLVSD